MVPEHLRLGGGVAGTVFNPVVAVIMVGVGLLMLFLPQRKAIIPFLLASILIPMDQVLVVAGLHFPVLRVLILVGMIRIFLIKGAGKWNLFSGGMNRVDKAVIMLSMLSALAGIALFRSGEAFIYQGGQVYTALGTYVLLRCLIRDRQDMVRVMRAFAVIVVLLGGVMVFEHFTRGWNPYALLEGARANDFASDMMRDGRIRASGSFAQPILAGTFGAVLLPLFASLWLSDRKQKTVALIGMFGATVMTLASGSTTPLMGYMAGIGALCFWPLRGMTRVFRWSIVGILVLLQMTMTSPVYHIITHIHAGDSYHRYELVNQTVLHFSSWWLIGTKSTAEWGWDMWDIANQYISNAVDAGLLGLFLFIAILVFGFKYVGRARRAAGDQKEEMFFWALGSALFAYTIAFFGISLWDQSVIAWYTLLAFIGALAAPQAQKVVEGLAVKLQPAMNGADAEPVYAGWRGRRFGNSEVARDQEGMRNRKELVHRQRVRGL